jgi:uncharacterized membrane protein YgcG
MALSVVLAMVRKRPVPTSCYTPDATETALAIEQELCCKTDSNDHSWRPKDHWWHHYDQHQHHDQHRDDIGGINITINRMATPAASSSAPSAWAYQGGWTPPPSASTSSSSAWAYQGGWNHEAGNWHTDDAHDWYEAWKRKHEAGKEKQCLNIVEEEEDWGPWTASAWAPSAMEAADDEEVEYTKSKSYWSDLVTHVGTPSFCEPTQPPKDRHYISQGLQPPKRHKNAHRVAPTAKRMPKKKNQTVPDLTSEFVDEISNHWEDIYAEVTEEWQGKGGTGGIIDEEDYWNWQGKGGTVGGCDGGGGGDGGGGDDGGGGGDDGGGDEAGERTGPRKRKRGTKIRAGRKIQFMRFVQMLKSIKNGRV